MSSTRWSDRRPSKRSSEADIVAVEGDALADLRSLERVGFVMKGGMVYTEP